MTGFPNQFPWQNNNNSNNAWQNFPLNTQPNNNFLGQRTISNFGQTSGNQPTSSWPTPLNNAQPSNNFSGQNPSFPMGQMPPLVDISNSISSRRIVKVKKEQKSTNVNRIATQHLVTNNSNNQDVPHSATPPPSPKFENKETFQKIIKREYPSSPNVSSPTSVSEDLSPALSTLCITPEQVTESNIELPNHAETLFQHVMQHETDTEEYKIAFKMLKEMADSDDPQACNLLANCYVEKDQITAFKYYKKAADLGDAEACNSVAICYEDGQGVEENEGKSYEYFEKAANLGWGLANSRLGDFYNVKGKYKEAAKYYEKAIDHDALFIVSGYYLHGRPGVAIDIPKGIELMKKSAQLALQENNYEHVLNCVEILLNEGAQESMLILLNAINLAMQKQAYHSCLKLAKFASEKGNAEAHYIVGWLYFYGKTSSVGHKDYLQAIVYFTKANNAGNLKSCYFLGLCNENGWGCQQNFAHAVTYYQRAGLHKDALVRLASLCVKGQGIVQSYPMAIHLLKQAKEISQKEAQLAQEKANQYLIQNNTVQNQNYLAQVQKHLAFSFQCIQFCAKLGDLNSINELAFCYQEGKGVTQNSQMAALLFNITAQRGNATGIYNLAVCYDNGLGVEQNSVLAAICYSQVSHDANARSRIAELILFGEIPDISPEEGFEYLLQEAAAGNERAKEELKLRVLRDTNNNNNAENSESEPSSES